MDPMPNNIADLDDKIQELESMRRTLKDLVERCHGDLRPECPILADLASAGAPEDADETLSITEKGAPHRQDQRIGEGTRR